MEVHTSRVDTELHAVCRNCGEPIHALIGHCEHWIHDYGLMRCQRNVPAYGPVAEP
jgi:hypothetical protein